MFRCLKKRNIMKMLKQIEHLSAPAAALKAENIQETPPAAPISAFRIWFLRLSFSGEDF